MSLESEENSSGSKAIESLDESQKSSKMLYSRDFLLSLSELEICKKLPSEFDRSILSEFEDFSRDIQERPRIPGGVPLQGFRRSEYGSSPPTRSESGNYSRGTYGRWDNRSAVRNDKESDSQSDWDSESGKRYGNTSRRTWQGPDHDGLLGSGSFPRPSGYAAGIMAPKGRGDDQFQLKKSNEPYHPPRPYKAVPHIQREFNDSLNDETFGSSERSNEDRAEEERKRRASFELMRKEQHKVLQDKHKLHLDKRKDDIFSEDNALLEETKDGRALELSSELNESGAQSFPNNESGNSSAASQISAPKPLVPPGFGSTVLEKNPGPKSFNYTLEKEIVKHELYEKMLPVKAKPLQIGILSTHGHVDGSTNAAFSTEDEMVANPLSGLELGSKKLDWDNHPYGSSSLMQSSGEATDNNNVIPMPTKKMTMDNISGDSEQENSVSILEKLFNSSLQVNTISNFTEPCDSKPDVTGSPNMIQSSKFARWFVEDEKKSTEDLSSVRPSDLLSLIVGGEKGGLQASNVKGSQHIPPEITHHSLEFTNRVASSLSSAATGISEQLYIDNKLDVVPEVLTCEDLEQKILSEYTENSSTLKPPVPDSTVPDVVGVVPKVSVDNHASVHLLSLLQKGTNLKEKNPIPSVEIGFSNTFFAPAVDITGTAPEKPGQTKTETFQNAGKNITLETLFGSAFMKELQSVEAPVSVKRVLPGSARADIFEPHGLSFPMIDAGVVPPSTFDEISSNYRNYENNAFASNLKQQTKSEQVENWLGFEDPKTEVGFPEFPSEGRLKHGYDGAAEIQLPEEESLFTVGDPLNPSNSIYMPAANSNKGDFVSSNTSISVTEKLASLNSGYKDEQSIRAQEGNQFVRGPYDMEPGRQYQNLHAKAPPPQFHPPNMSHGRHLFHEIESQSSHITPQMKFIAPESIKHDVRSNSQFPGNMLRPPFHHPNTGAAGFDPPAHHQMLRQMQMSGFTPPNLLHEFPRSGSVPLHPSNQPNAFMPELNSMQGFPFSQRHGMPLPAPDVSGGSNHPEAPLQRLLGMELRANPKPVHTFGGNSQGSYNHELDMGFPYR